MAETREFALFLFRVGLDRALEFFDHTKGRNAFGFIDQNEPVDAVMKLTLRLRRALVFQFASKDRKHARHFRGLYPL